VNHYEHYEWEDERIKSANNKIHSEGFVLLLYGLLILIIIRVIILGHPFHSTWDIILLFLGASLYVTLRHVLSGNFSEEYEAIQASFRHKLSMVFSGLLAGIFFTVFRLLREGFPGTAGEVIEILVSLIVFVVVFMGVGWLMRKLSHRKAYQEIDN